MNICTPENVQDVCDYSDCVICVSVLINIKLRIPFLLFGRPKVK